MELGTEEGDTCGLEDCPGALEYPEVENCYCHISAPCWEHENNPLTCNECGREVE